MGTRYSAVRRWRVTVALFLGLVLLGCSDARQRYRVLSLFFDGVPDPDAQAAGPARKNAIGQTVYLHKPYEDKKCDACHLNSSDIFQRAKIRPDACMTCHSAVQSEHKVTHGPVASNLCLYCHSPHHSIQPHLLKMAAPKLCTQCHETLGPNPPEHKDPKADCISCHSGHGGDDRRFIRLVSQSTTAPASTQPSGAKEVLR
jgi:predicted CXXCH cytochrome family protein